MNEPTSALRVEGLLGLEVESKKDSGLTLDESALIERCLRGITVDDETLALDLIHEIGPGGAFVATDHTRRHFQDELLIPDLIGREPREAWEAAGAPDMRTRAREKARRILAEHRPAPLTDGVAAQLDEIVKEAEAQCASLTH